MPGGRLTLHQVTDAAVPGDAITDQALILQRWLRDLGYKSDIYSLHYAESLASQIKLLNHYRPGRKERYLLYHHGVGSETVEMLANLDIPLILFYHNITPPEFYADVDPALAQELVQGRSQLETIRARTVLGLGASDFSVLELKELGFQKTGVLPIALDESDYNVPLTDTLLASYRHKHPLLLFVGRLAPNKRQGDLIKLLYYLRRISPNAHLVLVGRIHHRDYQAWLSHLCASLGLEDAVTITDHVSQEEMVTFYKMADLFVSMSEHEGFGKPLIESMYFGVPVMAYASTAIPDTMGDAGVLFHEKNYEALAETADLILHDEKLRAQIIAGQKRRVEDFLEPSIKRQLRHFLQELAYFPQPNGILAGGQGESATPEHTAAEVKVAAGTIDPASRPGGEFSASLMERMEAAWEKREPRWYERLAPAQRLWVDKLVAIRLAEFQDHLAALDREDSQLAHQIAELTAQIVQLKRQVEQLESRLDQVEPRRSADRQD